MRHNSYPTLLLAEPVTRSTAVIDVDGAESGPADLGIGIGSRKTVSTIYVTTTTRMEAMQS